LLCVLLRHAAQYEQLSAAPGALCASGVLLVAPEAAAAPPSATAAPAEPDGPDAWGDWRRVRDASGGGHYFYNTVSAETTWTQPAGWGSALAPAAPGYFYRDLSGTAQGPFELAHIAAWRGVLPLELPVWWSDGAGSAAAVTPLAHVLGDTELLSLLHGGGLPLPRNATAAQVEQALAAAAATVDAEDSAWWEAQAAAAEPEEAAAAAGREDGGDDDDGAGGGGGISFAELAAASLAGLPPEERSRVLAGGGAGEDAPRRAHAAVQDDYDSAPVMNKLTGRLTASGQLRGEDALAAKRGAAPEYFSAQMDYHCDTTKLEAWLLDMKARKHEKLPPAVIKALKERKAARKKANLGWLRD
jgi:hypothetical protein